ncbi:MULTISPECIES: shikimate dehydrogenase [unclassified Polaromonas]|uniref:shikimate dehydrogenase n=1 Tax=unclassified Polaromonas TaxID=2638319 RepID=UPI000F08D777|nr:MULTISPECIES: shikimate dehydrogenase [unclassified Polaromonas]AYQ27058.1 shikimate dehydrogenase [Polaromonas sp. SP1]QGJ18097.1 shikimate dehydrogenase [Polaromonas sp. Pch-P]
MDQYYVLGNPIAHSKSPLIHARFAELTGQTLQYERLLVPLDAFAATLAQLAQDGVKGCNITVPFKLEAFEAAATLTDRAQLARAANTLKLDGGLIHADNTDGVGLVNDIQNNAGVSLAGRDVLLIGAGGAGAGALAPLLAAGPRRLVLVNRTRAKADALVDSHKAHPSMQALLQKTELQAQDLPGLQGNFDVIINASASSLAGAGVPVAACVLKPGALACDMMYGPAAAGFMVWAKDHGATPRDGLGMLVEQAAEAFEIWRKVRPPSAQVLREMRAQFG